MQLIDRSAFLSKVEKRYITIDVPDLGPIRIQSLSERERNEVELQGVDRRGNADVSKLKDMGLRWIIACVVDEHGNRMFAESDLDTLRDLDSSITAKIADACLAHVSNSSDPETIRGN